MIDSILTSVKKNLGLAEEYVAFDHDIITHINSAFSTANQLGVGPVGGFTIEDDEAEWSDLGISQAQLNLLKSYIYLKVRMLFDPPATSFHIQAMNEQIAEHESRLSYYVEDPISYPVVEEV